MKKQILICLIWIGVTTLTFAQPPSYDQKLGEDGAKQIATTIGLYEEEELTAYVSEVGNRLIRQLSNNPFVYQFFILDEPIPNAFALPGGYVYVTRGLLALIDDVDQLACVMSHEIIHVHRRHSVRQMKRGFWPAVLQLPGLLIGAVAGEDVGQIINTPIAVGSSFFEAKYSRKHETEADDLGVQLATRGGFDPNALSPILARITQWEEARTERVEEKNYFSSHPYTPDRIQNLNDATAGLTVQLNEMHQQSILDVLSDLPFGENPDKGIFFDSLFLHPVMDFSMVFPSGWTYINQHNAVGAMNETKDAFLFLMLADTAKSPEQHGIEVIERAHNLNKKVKSESVQVNNRDAFLISTVEQVDGEEMHVHFIWIQYGDQVFKITAIRSEDFKEGLKQASLSLHPLTPSDKARLYQKRLTLVESVDAESIAELTARTNNVLSPNLLKILNGLPADEDSIKGTVKVVSERPYFDENSDD